MTDDSQARAPDPPGLLWGALACVGVGFLGLNALPLIVGAMIDGLGVDASRAGVLASVEIAAMAVISLVLAPRIGALSRRAIAVPAILLVAVAHGSSALATDLFWLACVRFVAGIGEGAALAAANAAIAGSSDPERLYARVSVVGGIAAAVFLGTLPLAITAYAHEGAFLAMALVATLSLPLAAWVPAHPDRPVREVQSNRRILTAPHALAVLAGASILAVGEGAIWTFAERIGVGVGLSTGRIGLILGGATLAGISGAAAAAVLGTRFGRALPLALGLAAVAVSSLLLAHATSPAVYTGMQLGYAVGYFFVTPYVMGIAAALDAEGRVAAALGGLMLVGAGIGPAAAGVFVESSGIGAVGWLVVAAVAVTLALVIPVALALGRGPAPQPEPVGVPETADGS